jgi:hypothetical protein
VIAIASARGLTLAFDSEKDLSKVIDHLQGMKEHKKGRGYPATYLTYPDKKVTVRQAHAELARARRAARRK